MAVARCLNCGNFSINRAHAVIQGKPCEETPHCKESAREERDLRKREENAFRAIKRARKAQKNARRAGPALRAQENQDRANGKMRVATR